MEEKLSCAECKIYFDHERLLWIHMGQFHIPKDPQPQATSELDESAKIKFIEETRKNIDQIMKELGQKIMKDDAALYEKYLKDRELKEGVK